MVKFLLDNNADANIKWVSSFRPKLLQHSDQSEVFITFPFILREPGSGFTPLMEAAASGHEIIVQNLLDHVSSLPPQICSLSLKDRATAAENLHATESAWC